MGAVVFIWVVYILGLWYNSTGTGYKMSRVIVHDINGAETLVDAGALVFNPAVYGVVIRDDSVLLLPVGGKYAIPGGSIELGENHIDALVREIKEETGFEIVPEKLLTVYTSLYQSFKTGTNYHCLQLFYLCKIIGNVASAPEFTADEQRYLKPAEWHKISELNKLQYIGNESVFDLIIDTAGY